MSVAQCKHGHPLIGDNLIERTRNGRVERECRTCGRRRVAEYRARLSPEEKARRDQERKRKRKPVVRRRLAATQVRIGAVYGHESLSQKFWGYVYPEPNTGCWLWAGSTNCDGYGTFSTSDTPTTAHRRTYLALIGDPGELQLDHLCRVRACCNPEHLDPVTNRENSHRSPILRKKTHCVNGHEYTPENTKWSQGAAKPYPRRSCRTCGREQRALARQSK